MITEGLSTTLTTAFNSVQTGVTDIITIALPPALGIMALILALRIGIRFFKGASK